MLFFYLGLTLVLEEPLAFNSSLTDMWIRFKDFRVEHTCPSHGEISSRVLVARLCGLGVMDSSDGYRQVWG